MSNHEDHVRLAFEQARIAEAAGDHPYGSVITGPRGTVVVRNRVETTQDSTAHAELVAVREANAQWGLDLSDATLITSYEPCPLCAGAIMNSGIKNIVIALGRTLGEEPLGQYNVENLLEMCGVREQYTITRGVLEDEAAAYYATVS